MKFELYFPSKNSIGVDIDENFRNEILHRVCKEICTISGGVTVDNHSQGYYMADNGTMIVERINRVWTSISEGTYRKFQSEFHGIIKSIRDILAQESIAYAIDDNMYFYTGKEF